MTLSGEASLRGQVLIPSRKALGTKSDRKRERRGCVDSWFTGADLQSGRLDKFCKWVVGRVTQQRAKDTGATELDLRMAQVVKVTRASQLRITSVKGRESDSGRKGGCPPPTAAVGTVPRDGRLGRHATQHPTREVTTLLPRL